MLQPVAVLDHADRVIAPEAHAAQFDIVATGIDDVIEREQRLGPRGAHIGEDQPAILMGRIGRLPDIHALPELRGLARHVDALALRVVQPAVIAAPDAARLDLPPFQ